MPKMSKTLNKKILIITEAYEKTVNGVWTTLKSTAIELRKMKYDVIFITPEKFKSIQCPTYQELRIVLNPWKVGKMIESISPEYIHIATEGPLGYFAVKYCEKHGLKFNTSYHTKFPEYMNTRFSFIKADWIYNYLRRFHKNSNKVLVTTKSMKTELEEKYFKNLEVWGRGVDTNTFNSYHQRSNKLPILLYVGRISIEKNIEAFLSLDLPFNHTKVVVGDGPLLEHFKAKYPDVSFKGAKKNNQLPYYYATADVMVFPSLTDTFGIVMIEASACGTPVAAFPVTGPIDYIEQGVTGYMDSDLSIAIQECLKLSRRNCEIEASKYTWKECTKVFERNLIEI